MLNRSKLDVEQILSSYGFTVQTELATSSEWEIRGSSISAKLYYLKDGAVEYLGLFKPGDFESYYTCSKLVNIESFIELAVRIFRGEAGPRPEFSLAMNLILTPSLLSAYM